VQPAGDSGIPESVLWFLFLGTYPPIGGEGSGEGQIAASAISQPVGKRISFQHFSESMKRILIALIVLLLAGPAFGQQTAAYWCNKGLALGKQVKYDESIKAYDEAIRLNPKLAAAWNGKGCALQSLGRFADADAALAKAKELGYSR
jgi:tetratricopeptide (TPR) repeat protein